ncbi:MAG: S-layer homology domain-containing protein, partial [Actinomycetota bacterium]|nr:S-layer homology domain-containing protein [Actinomycetota bacterium]
MFLAALAHSPLSADAASPAAYVTRAAFAEALSQDLDLPPTPNAPQAFSDLPQTDPAYGLVMAAYKAGWISGYPGGTFRPNAPLTREQVAKAEIIALGLGGEAAGLTGIRPPYRDSGDIGRWAYGYIDKATRIGVLAGTTQGLFEPQASFTQAEFNYAQSRLTAYIATAPVPELASRPAAKAGPAMGTTLIAATPWRTGDRLALAVSAAPIARPTRLADLPQDIAP